VPEERPLAQREPLETVGVELHDRRVVDALEQPSAFVVRHARSHPPLGPKAPETAHGDSIMQPALRIPTSPFVVRAALAALSMAGVACHTRDVAAPAHERIVYVNSTPPPPSAPAPAAAPPAAAPPATETVVVTQAPPAQMVETIPPCPGPTYYWVGGRWVWRDRWVWAPGFWSPRPWNQAVWVEGHWVHRHHEWVWVNGHWR